MHKRLVCAATALLALAACSNQQTTNTDTGKNTARSNKVTVAFVEVPTNVAKIVIDAYTTTTTTDSTGTVLYAAVSGLDENVNDLSESNTAFDGKATFPSDGSGSVFGQVFVGNTGAHWFYATAYDASSTPVAFALFRGKTAGIVPANNATTLDIQISLIDFQLWQSKNSTVYTAAGPIITGITRNPLSTDINTIAPINTTPDQPTTGQRVPGTLPSFTVTAADPLGAYVPQFVSPKCVPSSTDATGYCTRPAPTFTYSWSAAPPPPAAGQITPSYACSNVVFGTQNAATTTYYDNLAETCVVTVAVTKVTADATDTDNGTSSSMSFSFAVTSPTGTVGGATVTGSFVQQPMITSVTLSPLSDEAVCFLDRSSGSSCPTPYRAMGQTIQVTFTYDIGSQDPALAVPSLPAPPTGCGSVGSSVTKTGTTATATWILPAVGSTVPASGCTLQPKVTMTDSTGAPLTNYTDTFNAYVGLIQSSAPAAPTVLTATPSTSIGGRVALTWTSAESQFVIARSTTSGSGYVVIATSATGAYTDTTAVDGIPLYYIVRAVADGETSPNSNEATAQNNVVPATPTNLAATASTSGRIDLSWTGSVGASGYRIYRTGNGDAHKLIAVASSASFSDFAVLANTQYSYTVAATSAAGTSAETAATALVTTPVPTAPTGLSAHAASSTSMNVRWTSVAGATGYNILRAATSGGTYTQLNSTTLTTPSYTDTGLTANTTYYYVVQAVYPGPGVTGDSAVAAGTTSPPPPTGLSTTLASGKVQVEWTASNQATSYTVYRSTTNGSRYAYVGTSSASPFTDAALTPVSGTTYYYVVQAVSAAGSSENSAQVSYSAP